MELNKTVLNVLYSIVVIVGFKFMYSMIEANAYTIILFLSIFGVSWLVFVGINHDPDDSSKVNLKTSIIGAGFTSTGVMIIIYTVNYLELMSVA